MTSHCFMKDCELEVQHVCACLSSETFCCEIHLGAHLKLPNRTHAFDSILVDPSEGEWTKDAILGFLEKERSKKRKLKKIVLASFRQNLYNSKSSIEETLRKLDNEIEEISAIMKAISQTLKQEQDLPLSTSILQPGKDTTKAIATIPDYQEVCTSTKPFWTMSQLKAKRFAILSQTNNDPDIEQNFRQTCSSYENNVSDPLLNQAYQEYKNDYHRITSLYLIDETNNLFIYDTENENEEMKKVEIPRNFNRNSCIVHLPNGDLFCFDNGISLIINKDYRIRVLPSGGYYLKKPSAIYFKKNVYCFFGEPYHKSKNEEYRVKYKYNFDYMQYIERSCRFDLNENRWIPLTKIPLSGDLGNSIVFNSNIMTSVCRESNIFIYSIDLDSFSTIPYEFDKYRTKILATTKERLYLIEYENGSVYESGVGDEYAWQRVANSFIDCSSFDDQVDCLYNKGKICVSFIDYKNIRWYLKFDLDKKTFIDIACYSQHAALGIIDSKLKAIECYDQTFKLDPGHAAAYIDNELTLYDIVSYLEVIEECNWDIKSYSKCSSNYYKKGYALYILGRNLEAVECYSKSIKLGPGEILNYIMKSRALCCMGRNLEAIECCNELIKRGAYSSASYWKGNALHNLGRNIEAIEAFNAAISHDTKSDYLYYSKGNALYDLGKYLEAVESYDTAIEINNKKAIYHFKKGIALYDLSKNIESMKCYCETIKLDSDDPLYLCYLTHLLSNLGHDAKAIQNCNKAHELISHQISVYPYWISSEDNYDFTRKPLFQCRVESVQALIILQENLIEFKEEIKNIKNESLNSPKIFKQIKKKVDIVKKQHWQLLKRAADCLVDYIMKSNEAIQQIENETTELQKAKSDTVSQLRLLSI